ncbi:TPA: hypothetical protein PTV43_002378 [Clostridium botulinum]|nr:hypothetical protein [Clostridium botulinum]
MLGLKNCSEEDFHEFVYSNSRYCPEDIDGNLLDSLLCISVFLGIAYIYLISGDVKYMNLIKIIIKILVLSNIFFLILSRVNKKKYAFKFQKFMIIVVGINWLICSLIMYPGPLILAYYKKQYVLMNIIIYTMMIGFIYLIFIFTKLVILIRKGEMRKGRVRIYDRLFGKKIAYLGCSAPIIVIVSKLTCILTTAMHVDVGPLIGMLVFAFIMEIALSSIVSECNILAYCKFRFESFHFPYVLNSVIGKKLIKHAEMAKRNV